jgi:hypothetical protein
MHDDIPDISFDETGVCNFCHQFDAIAADNPQGAAGLSFFRKMTERIRRDGIGHRYDLVIGVSGGVDSMYLVHLACSEGLRPLAVNFDNGWHSEIAVGNIETVLKKLGVDLETYVVDYEEMKDLLLSYMKSGLPWIDGPTDLALIGTLYRKAAIYGIRHIWVGNNFRTEGKQPVSWTYTDMKQLKHIQKIFGKQKIRDFPGISISKLFYFSMIRKIRMHRPFNILDYSKEKAREFLKQEYEWRDYGGHHHESVFTRYAISQWLPQKHGIDKRIVSLSAQIRSGMLSREDALKQLSTPPIGDEAAKEDLGFVKSKLGISNDEYEKIWMSPCRNFTDYPSSYPLFSRYRKMAGSMLIRMLPFKPMINYELKSLEQKSKSDL